MSKNNFQQELASLINKYHMEARSDTPDYLLATYLVMCLDAFSHVTRNRDDWHNFKPWDLANAPNPIPEPKEGSHE